MSWRPLFCSNRWSVPPGTHQNRKRSWCCGKHRPRRRWWEVVHQKANWIIKKKGLIQLFRFKGSLLSITDDSRYSWLVAKHLPFFACNWMFTEASIETDGWCISSLWLFDPFGSTSKLGMRPVTGLAVDSFGISSYLSSQYRPPLTRNKEPLDSWVMASIRDRSKSIHRFSGVGDASSTTTLAIVVVTNKAITYKLTLFNLLIIGKGVVRAGSILTIYQRATIKKKQ